MPDIDMPDGFDSAQRLEALRRPRWRPSRMLVGYVLVFAIYALAVALAVE